MNEMRPYGYVLAHIEQEGSTYAEPISNQLPDANYGILSFVTSNCKQIGWLEENTVPKINQKFEEHNIQIRDDAFG